MKQRFSNKIILISIFLLPLAFPMGLQSAGLSNQAANGTNAAASSSLIYQEKIVPVQKPLTASQDHEQQVSASKKENEADILTMKQRYRQDPTGVRARLGLCRKGKGGPGGGPPGRFRGGKRWIAE